MKLKWQLVMAKGFASMNENDDYLNESDEIMDGLDTPLDDEEQWWKEK